jgi:hypothetical protein
MRWADPPPNESYLVYKKLTVSELILNRNGWVQPVTDENNGDNEQDRTRNCEK